MNVTYLNHSGFLLEWENCYWLFDYYKGTLPVMDSQKDIFVFCSHSHGDHFNPVVYELSKKYPKVTYIFSNEMRKKCSKLETPMIHFLKSHTDTTIQDSKGQSLKIHTLLSTDCGCAFTIEYENCRIYHAGDLHWWHWEGEDPDWNKKVAADYKKEIKYLEGKRVDLAFAPLDPRQGKDYALGMNYLLQHVSVKNIFPMHFWDDFSIIDKYLQENEAPEGTVFHQLKQDGQRSCIYEKINIF